MNRLENTTAQHQVRNQNRMPVSMILGIGKAKNVLVIGCEMLSRIICATAKRVNLPGDKVFININEYGNASSASIPIAMAEARETGRIKKSNLVLLVAFGGGFTWGAAFVRF